MQAINQFGGLTTDRMASDLEQIILDQFIDSCSVEMLNRFEQFLHITGYEKRSISERRSIVKVNWIGNIKMNRTQIKALIRAYFGCDSEVHFTHEIIIIIKIQEANSTISAKDLLNIFDAQIPSHLKWSAILQNECFKITNINKMRLSELRLHTAVNNKTSEIIESVNIVISIEPLHNDIECTLIIKKNMWYLDGSKKLDGSKCLNAIVEREEL